MSRYWTQAGTAALALCAALAQSAEYTDTVPVELLRATAPSARFYQGLPPGFPALPLPDGFQVVGSLDRGNGQLVLVSGPPDPVPAVDRLAAALRLHGWLLPRRKLASGGQPIEFRAFCRSQGTVLLSGSSEQPEQVTLHLLRTPREEDPICGSLAYPSGPAGGVAAYAPQLRAGSEPPFLPPGIFPPGLASSGPTRLEVPSLRYLPGARAADLDDLYAAQLREQGWTQDAKWDGGEAAGSSWLREVEGGFTLHLSLVVEALSSDIFHSQLLLRSLP